MSGRRELLKRLNLKNPWHLLAVGFGSGLAPKAPGTCGSLAALPIVFIALYCGGAPALAAVCLITCFVGWKACSEAERAMGVHDHGGIVIDEFAGMFLSALTVPADSLLLGCLSTFVFFRFFDILKPFPVGWLDRHVKGGLGIMVDDLAAGVLAAVCNFILFSLL